MKTIKHRKVAFPWNTKGVCDALLDQTLNNQVSGNLLAHAFISCSGEQCELSLDTTLKTKGCRLI
jgi:hypothetical protein